MRRLSSSVAVSTIALTLADLTFKRVLAERLPPRDLATVFGAIYTGAQPRRGSSSSSRVTSRLLARWGVGSALAVLPVLLLSTATGFALTGAVLAIILLKLADGGLRHSLHRVGSEILYLPVPSLVRDGWKPIADAISQRGGQALAALLALALASIGAGSRAFAAVIAVIALGWLIAITIAQRAYVAQFRDTLKAQLDGWSGALGDPDAHDPLHTRRVQWTCPDCKRAFVAAVITSSRRT